MKLRLLVLALASSLALRAADTLPLFNATLATGHETRFLLVSPAGKTSPWLKVGDTFEGYALKAYDAKAAALDLERDGKTTRITLVADATVANAPAASTSATLADATALMSKIHIDDLAESWLDQKRNMVMAGVKRVSASFPKADPADVAAFQGKELEVFNSSFDHGLIKAEITRVYSETFSKDELDQVAAFNDTPVGRAVLAKLPEVHPKVDAALLQRLDQISPTIQQIVKDFAMDQKSKLNVAPVTAAAPATVSPPAPALKP